MKIEECMSTDVVWAPDNSNINGIAKLMNDNDIGSVPICDSGKNVVGIITDRDIVIRCIADDKETKTTKAADIMSENLIFVTPKTDVQDAAEIMADYQVRRLPVIDDSKLVGVISIGDLALEDDVEDEDIADTLSSICDRREDEE